MTDTSKPFHQQIAEKLIEQLKQGVAPWQRPWKTGEPGTFLPKNPVTGKRYRGINAIHLMSQNYGDQRWMTYKQALSLEGQVRKGEKGTVIQYWKFSEEQDKTDDNGKPILGTNGEKIKEEVRLERPRVFFATVFNAEQIDGLPELEKQPHLWNSIERAEQILKTSGAVIKHFPQNRAFYNPLNDSIQLPDKSQFSAADGYYSTALHELGHWTGHSSRLARDLSHPFGSEEYAKEELRAEIASMILSDEIGIGYDPGQHVAYVSLWIKVIQENSLEIFRAAADAEKIHDYVLGFEQKLIQSKASEVVESLKKLNNTEQLFSDINEKITLINVPYKEKDEAKSLGARWDRQKQSWYIPIGLDSKNFSKWFQLDVIKKPDQQKDSQLAQQEFRQYLAVPYGEREAARAAGAFWDKQAKSWCVGPEVDIEKLKRWLPDNVPFQQNPPLNPRDEFTEMLRSVGCIISGDHPVMDGNKHRISVEGDKKGEQAGFYVGYFDGHPAGYIKNNRTGIEIKWKSKGYVIDAFQKKQLKMKAIQNKQIREEEILSQYEEAAKSVSQQAEKLIPITTPTPYLKAKGIELQNGIFTDKEGKKTFIPAFDENGKQWTVQCIQEDGTKRFAKNSRKHGCFHVIGGLDELSKSPVIVIAEGYATAASISKALEFGAVAAFDAGNLEYVAKVLHAKFPDKPIIIAGDNDQYLEETQGINPGKTKAITAARAVEGKAMFPVFTPTEKDRAKISKNFTDFNDLANKSELGEEGIKRQVRFFVDKVISDHKANINQIKKLDRTFRQEKNIQEMSL